MLLVLLLWLLLLPTRSNQVGIAAVAVAVAVVVGCRLFVAVVGWCSSQLLVAVAGVHLSVGCSSFSS